MSWFTAKPKDTSKFTEFVNIYGEGGIPLRELLMIASIRYLRTIEASTDRREGELGESPEGHDFHVILRTQCDSTGGTGRSAR